MAAPSAAPGNGEPVDRLLRPFQMFAAHKLSGAFLLLGAGVAAILWANSRWGGSYGHLLETVVAFHVGDFGLSKSLHHWINDGLMGLFFFVVGLEIKREILAGELSSLRKALLPIVAAAGGMVAPAAFYLILNYGEVGHRGWGVPMATDIAFALGVLALLGDRVPVSLKLFLTALAIVDDIGAILVIAIFYTESIFVPSLLAGAVVFVVAIAANRIGVRNPVFYYALGTLMWLSFLKSGVHATLAAVLIAMTIPVRSRICCEPFFQRMDQLTTRLRELGVPARDELATPAQQEVFEQLDRTVNEAVAPLQRIEHALLPLVTFVVLPVFALANAGVTVGGDFGQALGSPVCLGIILGLFLGKQAGILGFSYLAVRLGIADLPANVSWRMVHAVSILGGVGFTMALFVNDLAFASGAFVEVGKIGVLVASILSGAVGYGLLRMATRPSASSIDSVAAE